MGWTTHTSNVRGAMLYYVSHPYFAANGFVCDLAQCHINQINRKKRATVVQDPINDHHASGVSDASIFPDFIEITRNPPWKRRDSECERRMKSTPA